MNRVKKADLLTKALLLPAPHARSELLRVLLVIESAIYVRFPY
jgi:hypothetical protein